jgi:hypothetical protein
VGATWLRKRKRRWSRCRIKIKTKTHWIPPSQRQHKIAYRYRGSCGHSVRARSGTGGFHPGQPYRAYGPTAASGAGLVYSLGHVDSIVVELVAVWGEWGFEHEPRRSSAVESSCYSNCFTVCQQQECSIESIKSLAGSSHETVKRYVIDIENDMRHTWRSYEIEDNKRLILDRWCFTCCVKTD